MSLIKPNRREGKHHRFKDLEFWAEEGVILIEDQLNGDVTAATCKDFVTRAKCIYDEIPRMKYADERKELQDGVINMHAVWKEAKEQGDPMDPEVARKKYLERKRAGKATLIVAGSGW